MTRKTSVNVSASVRALLKVSKERREDFTLTLMNYAAERFLYRLAQSQFRDRFVLKGAMLFAVRVGERYRPTRDLDLLGLGEASEAAVATAIRDIATTKVDDDGLVFDVDGLEVQAILRTTCTAGFTLSCRRASRKRVSMSRSTLDSAMRLLRRQRTSHSRRYSPTCLHQTCWRTRLKPSNRAPRLRPPPRPPAGWSMSRSNREERPSSRARAQP
jgi:Nucleotidyl transferase AbiEii toxin, Type IV TA system